MEPLLGQIILFGGNFPPRGWAFCNGQLLAISSNSALFSILGTIYGGDGRTTFGLPDLRGRAPVHFGQGPGLINIPQGAKGGSETHNLTIGQLPPHAHNFTVPTKAEGDTDDPNGTYVAGDGTNSFGTTSDNASAIGTTQNTGSGQAVNHRDPYIGMNYIIAVTGIFPSRS